MKNVFRAIALIFFMASQGSCLQRDKISVITKKAQAISQDLRKNEFEWKITLVEPENRILVERLYMKQGNDSSGMVISHHNIDMTYKKYDVIFNSSVELKYALSLINKDICNLDESLKTKYQDMLKTSD